MAFVPVSISGGGGASVSSLCVYQSQSKCSGLYLCQTQWRGRGLCACKSQWKRHCLYVLFPVTATCPLYLSVSLKEACPLCLSVTAKGAWPLRQRVTCSEITLQLVDLIKVFKQTLVKKLMFLWQWTHTHTHCSTHCFYFVHSSTFPLTFTHHSALDRLSTESFTCCPWLGETPHFSLSAVKSVFLRVLECVRFWTKNRSVLVLLQIFKALCGIVSLLRITARLHITHMIKMHF